MEKWKIYKVYAEDGETVMKLTIPAKSKTAAKKYAEDGNLRVLKIEDHELENIDIERLAETLYSKGWGAWEIDTITRVLIQVGLDR